MSRLASSPRARSVPDSPTSARRPTVASAGRARRAVACLVVAAEILVIASTGASSVTIECRIGAPFAGRRAGITVWIGDHRRGDPDRQVRLDVCATSFPVDAVVAGPRG